MPKNQESLNNDLFRLLQSRGYEPTMLSTSGKEIPVPDEAEVFQFTFTKDEKNYGTVTVSIDGLHKLVVYSGDDVASSPAEQSHPEDESWYSLLNHLKRFSQAHQLSFEVRNTDHLKHDMAKRNNMKKVDESKPQSTDKQINELSPDTLVKYASKAGKDRKGLVNKQFGASPEEKRKLTQKAGKRASGVASALNKFTAGPNSGHGQVAEGYYATGKKSSYSDAVPAVKIILQHNRALEEGERRYRAIDKIFVENVNGERFAIPTNKPGLARVYARHVAEGGTPYDEGGKHITALCEEYTKMAGFVRATRSKQFNESTQVLVNEGVNHYQALRETLHKMAGHRGYQAYFESWTPTLTEDEDTTDLSEMFATNDLDPRIESVMPILRKLNKTLAEMTEVNALDKWADDIIEESLGEEVNEAPSAGAMGRAADREYAQSDQPAHHVASRVAPTGPRPWVLKLNGKVIAKNSDVGVLRGIQRKQGGTIERQAAVSEEAKWRRGYSASGHPAGFKHKSGETGPVGGTFTNEPSGYDGETTKVPVQKHRDRPDQLADRGQTKLSTTGKPLTTKNAGKNLKAAIIQSRGKHGPVSPLPESQEDDGIYIGAKVYHREHQSGEPFKVVKIIDDQRVGVIDDYGNKQVMFIKQLTPATSISEDSNSDESDAIAQLSKLPQPIGINGGSYTYSVDVTKQPLRFTASDGSVLRDAKTLRDLADWMDNGDEWLDFLEGYADLRDLVNDGMVRPFKKRTTPWSDQEEHERQMDEGGRFIKGPGGVPLDRQGNPIPPKVKPAAGPSRAPKERKGELLRRVFRKVEDVVSNIYPDGDPIDWLGPWCKRQGIDYSIVDKACQAEGYDDVYAYWDSIAEIHSDTLGEADGLEAINPQGIPEAAKPNMMDHVYPDTKQGVLEYMKYGYKPSFLKQLDLPTCSIRADSSVEGVWAVDSMASGYRCIIYLAGYPGPMGDKREHNDNEEGGFTMKMMASMIRNDKLTPKLMQHWVKCGSLDQDDLPKLVKYYNDYKGIDEGLDPQQKAAGQAGPTDQGPLTGKLVGANESVDPLDRIKFLVKR